MKENEKTIVKGTFWGLIGNGWSKGISFFYLILIAYLFPQEAIGVFYLALSIIYLIQPFNAFGLKETMSRYVPYFQGKGKSEKSYSLYKNATIIGIFSSLILGAAIFLLSGTIADYFGNPDLEIALQVLSPFMLLGNISGLNRSLLRGLKKMKHVNILLGMENLVKIILTPLLALAMGADVLTIALGFVGAYAIVLALSYWFVFREIKAMDRGELRTINEELELLRNVMPLGIALSISGIIWSFVYSIDRTMLGYFLPGEAGAATIAVYTVATALATMLALIPSSVNSIFLPVVAGLHGQGNRKEIIETAESGILWTIILMTPVALVIFAFPKEILSVLYGGEYAVGWTALAIFSIGVMIRALSFVHSSILAALRLVKAELGIAGITLIVNICLNWFLIPVYGIVGAAVASSISFVIASIILMGYCKQKLNLSFPRRALKLFAVGITTFIVLLLLKGLILDTLSLVPDYSEGLEGVMEKVVEKITTVFVVVVMFAISGTIYLSMLLGFRIMREKDVELFERLLLKMRVPRPIVQKVVKIAGKKG